MVPSAAVASGLPGSAPAVADTAYDPASAAIEIVRWSSVINRLNDGRRS
jgi:hypothetical protein